MRAVHRVGLRSTATMMFGIGDKIEHRVRHLQRIRDLQDETGGFTAFIPWTFQRENTALGRRIKDEPTGVDYLKMLAVSRLFLDNIENFQSSWLTQGLRLGQVALRFGANDMGSIMIEENVVSAAGAHNRADEKMLQFLIAKPASSPATRHPLQTRTKEHIEPDLISAYLWWLLSNGEVELLLMNRRIARDVDWTKIVFNLDHHVALAGA